MNKHLNKDMRNRLAIELCVQDRCMFVHYSSGERDMRSEVADEEKARSCVASGGILFQYPCQTVSCCLRSQGLSRDLPGKSGISTY
jgi:hypothetical protein